MRTLISRANGLEPTDDSFEPTQTHHAIAGALTRESIETLTELAEAAGLARSTVSRSLSDPAALRWVVSRLTHLAADSVGAAHAVLLQRALTEKNPTWMKLYLVRFDEEFKKQQVAEKGRNTLNVFGQMSDEELVAYIKREARKAGASHPGNAPSPT